MKLYDQYFGKLPPRSAVTKTPQTVTASRKPGRPKKADALSMAERARAYRARKKTNG